MRGKTKTELDRIGRETRFKKGEERSRAMAERSVKVRKSRAVLRSSEAILEADRDGTLSDIVGNVLKSLDALYKKKSYDSYIKHAIGLLELVNGRQVKLETTELARRPVNIILRRATPEDVK